MLLGSAIVSVGIFALLWLTASRDEWTFWIIAVPLLLFMVLAFIASAWGCDSCVVRMWES